MGTRMLWPHVQEHFRGSFFVAWSVIRHKLVPLIIRQFSLGPLTNRLIQFWQKIKSAPPPRAPRPENLFAGDVPRHNLLA